MPEISLRALQQLASNPDLQLTVRENEAGQSKAMVKEVGWGGRLMRNLKIVFGEDRTTKQAEYMAAKNSVRDSLVREFGEEIGKRAFLAGAGRLSADGKVETSSNHPLTGRHVAVMLKAARDETARLQATADWVGGIRGGEPRQLMLGRKVSSESVQRAPEMAYDQLKTRLIYDIPETRENWGDDPHRFWVLDIQRSSTDRGEISGKRAEIGIHVHEDNTQMLDVRGVDGTEQMVDRGGIDRWLKDHLDEHFGENGTAHVTLYRTTEKLPEPEQHPDDLQVPPPVVQNNNSLDDRIQDFFNEVPQDRSLVVNLSQGGVNVRDRVAGFDDIVERNRTAIENDKAGVGRSTPMSKRFEERVATGQLFLVVGGEPQQLALSRQLMFGVNPPPGGAPPVLQSPMAEALSRFLDDRFLQDVHRGLFPQHEEIPDLDRVEIEIRTQPGPDGPVFDITFRGRLPEGSILASDREDLPDGADLVLQLHVARDEMYKDRPQFTVDDPVIEMRQRQ
jgi:hypothetical protein